VLLIVTQRVFRKDVLWTTDDWSDARKFDGDVRHKEQKTPWELACHDALNTEAGCESVVRMREPLNRNRHINDAQMTFKMYLEFCSHGSLQDLIGNHQASSTRIPESMVWNVAECLSDCGNAMYDGDRNAIGHWDQMVHRDLKPLNVFLAANHPRRWTHFPQPVLGDL